MTLFLDSSVTSIINDEPLKRESTISLEALEKLLDDYIPASILQHFDKSKVCFKNENEPCMNLLGTVQFIMDNSNNQLRMYGSAAELMNNLKIYHNFSLRHKKLGMPIHDFINQFSFEQPPFKFESLNRKVFHRKFDCVLHFHALIYTKFLLNCCQPPAALLECMTRNEMQLNNCHEFIEYDKSVFEKIDARIQLIRGNDREKGTSMFEGMNLPFLDSFNEGLRSALNIPPPSKNGENISDVDALKSIAKSYPEIFLPYSMENPKSPVIVRVFMDESKRNFVMKSELFNNRIMKNEGEIEDSNGILYTMDVDKVQTTFASKIKDIEFILIPIKRAKHAAVPIPTPSGDHCILALDALLEILRRLISALNIFQKFDKNNWNTVKSFMEILELKFPANSNCTLLIDTKQFDELKKKADDIWMEKIAKTSSNNKKKSLKKVREVSKFGFNRDDLKEELKHLMLLDAFPDIADTVDSVYSKIHAARNDQFLRTCDMYDAVEFCQIISILYKFPKLHQFLHTQQAGHNFLLEKSPSETTQNAGQNPDEWTHIEVKYIDVKSAYAIIHRGEVEWLLEAQNQIALVCNLKFMTDHEIANTNMKYFLLDIDDLKWASKCKKSPRLLNANAKLDDIWLSLDHFTKQCPKKRIYIRTFQCSTGERVFTDDVLEIIPIVLRQQNTPIECSDDRLEKYRLKWKPAKPHWFNTIDLIEVKMVLDDFEINKSLITLVPDLVNEISRCQQENSSQHHQFMFGPNGKKIMSPEKLIFKIFQDFVVGIKWNMNYCKMHPKCEHYFRLKIVEEMRKYLEMDNNVFEALAYHEENVTKSLRNHCTFMFQKLQPIPFYERPWYEAFSQIPVSVYKHVASSFNLKSRIIIEEGNGDAIMPCWLYRANYIMGWCDVFFNHSDLVQFDSIIRKCAANRIPFKIMKSHESLVCHVLDLKLTKHTDPNKAESKVEKAPLEPTVLEKPKSPEAPEEKDKLKIEQLSASVPPAIEEELINSPNPVESPIEVEKTREDTECMEVSLDNFVMLKKALKEKNLEVEELKKNQKALEEKAEMATDWKRSYEAKSDQLKKTLDMMGSFREETERSDEVRKKLEEAMERSAGSEKKAEKAVELERKLEEVKKEMMEKDAEIQNMRKESKGIEEKSKKNDNLEKKYNETLKKLEEEMIRSFEMEKDKNSEIQKTQCFEKMLEESNKNHLKELEEKNLENQKFLEESEMSEKTISDLEKKLEEISKETELQNLKTSKEIEQLKKNHSVVIQKKMDEIEKLKQSNLKLIKGKDAEIEKIKKSQEQQAKERKKEIERLKQLQETNQQQISEQSTANKQLQNKFLLISLENQQKSKALQDIQTIVSSLTSSNHPPTDLECLICFSEMKSEEKTLKCEQCQKVTHLECASKWLKIHRSCPHCRREQLDPNEFPNLQ